MVNEFHQKVNRSGESEIDYWMERFLVKLYLPHDRTPNYRDPLP